MDEGVKEQFRRRGVFWFISRFIFILLFIGFFLLLWVEQYVLYVILFLVMVAYIFALSVLPFSIMQKTATKIKDKDFQVDWWNIYDDCYLMIDTQKGRIATVWTTNPFKIQIVDGMQLREVQLIVGRDIILRNSTNVIAVAYWIGEKKYYTKTFHGFRSTIAIDSKVGQECIRRAEITRDKLLIARDVSTGYSKNSKTI